MGHLQFSSNEILSELKLARCLPKVASAVRGERNFLQIRSKIKIEGLQEDNLKKHLLIWISFCQELYIWFLIYNEFPNLLNLSYPVSSVFFLFFSFNFNSALPYGQHSCYI